MHALNLNPEVLEQPAMRIAGLAGEYTRETTNKIPLQWDSFNTQLAESEQYRGVGATFGVVYPLAVMRYVSGIELQAEAALPPTWVEVALPAQRFAVFKETGGLQAIRAAWLAIFSEWLPASGFELTAGAMIERYPDTWTSSGDFEIWLPLAG